MLGLELDFDLTGVIAAYAAAASERGILTEDMVSIQTESGENLEQD